MCGIFFYNKVPEQQVIDRMFNTLSKRGPDAQGLYKRDFIIGHTRLSIIDTDERSNQPMNIKGYVVSFNGEIYNYKELKKTVCKEWEFKTESDTEVIIALYHLHGIQGWKYLRGIFAFIFYHESRDKVYFVRDPLGVKPLYYQYYDGKLIVASKVSTILAVSGNKPVLDYRGVNEILALGYSRKPIYRNINELEPGHVYDKNLSKQKIDFIVNTKRTIKDAIIEQFVNSDRPVGVLLSGGIDSSYIAYVCSKISKKKIHTYTIGFSKNDEDVVYARELANYIGSEHHEIIINEKEYENNLWEGIEKLEQPFDLGSVSLTNAIGKEIAKTNIKVLLSGDANDEISGGYKRYAEKQGLRTQELWEWYKQRIIKNDFDDRKKIIKDETNSIIIDDLGYPDNANKILWCDLKNELRYYHLRRMDHIISDFGIELRVPYTDYDFVVNSFNKSFASKVNQRGDKLLVRDFAMADGLPEKFAFRKKVPMKKKDFDAKKHLAIIWQEWSRRNGY